jgi:FkbM family methyltransferase
MTRRPRIDRTYRMRSGLAAGLKKRGGLGLRQAVGLWSSEIPEEDAFLQELDYTGQTVYDIGGFEGIHAIFYASRVGPEGRVVVFEPHPGNAGRIRTNIAVNGLRNVEVREKGVAAEPGELTFHAIDGDTGRTSASPDIAAKLDDRGASSLVVPVTSVDAEVAAGSPAPAFVKIDVEGLETDVLRGMARTMREHRPRLFVELHGVGTSAKQANATAVTELAQAAGYVVEHVETRQVVATPADTPPEGHLYCS